MATSISSILIPCLKSFNQLQERVEQPDYSYEEEVSSVTWGDELGRLRIWAANIGAHQTGQSSLDFRLRDASHISKQVTNLLRDLDQSLNDIFEELSEAVKKDSEDDGTSAAWPDDNPTTELQQLHAEVVNIIDCLYQLSMLIRKPAQHDLLVGSRIGDKAEFEFYDQEHVRNLHPKTEEQITQRLGRAITRRRQYFNYRERHHRKLAQGIQRTTTGSVMSETIATDFKTHDVDLEETSSNSGMSQTSYAPSLIDGGRVTIPPPPKESMGGKPFECPYCFFLIDIKTTSMPDRLYDSRREWHLHETTEHLRRGDLVCALCKDTLKSAKQYERHVARHLEELALFALPRTEMEDAEDDDDDDDVFDARASTSEKGVAFETGYSFEHSDHSSSPSVTDDEDSKDTSVQGRPRSPAEIYEDSGSIEGRGDWTLVSPLVDSEDGYQEQVHSPHWIRRSSSGHRSRSPSPYYDYELEKKMREFELELLLTEAEKTKWKKEKEDLEKKVTESYYAQYPEEKVKKAKAEKEADEDIKARVREMLGQAGHDEEAIAKKTRDLTRPTYIKVHRKHMSPETLDEFSLPWEWDERDSNYIVIKQWVPEHDQIILFDHSKTLRSKRLRTQSVTEPAMECDGDKPLLNREHSPERRGQRERNTDDLPGVRRRTLHEDKPKEDKKHEEITIRRRGGGTETQPINKAAEPSKESDGETEQPPSRKQVPFGPYHHYRGSQ